MENSPEKVLEWDMGMPLLWRFSVDVASLGVAVPGELQSPYSEEFAPNDPKEKITTEDTESTEES